MIIAAITLFFLNTIFILFLGYKWAVFSTLAFSIFYTWKQKQNINDYLIVIIFSLAIFDNPIFTYNYGILSGIRPQTIPAVLCASALIISFFRGSNIDRKLIFILLIALTLTIFFDLFSDTLGILYSIKYWCLYWIPAIWIFFQIRRRNSYYIPYILIIIILFVAIYGLFQLTINYTASNYIRAQFQYDWMNISPSAFFSERTWYGAFCACGLPILFLLLEKGKISNKEFLFSLLILSIGVFVSYSRNAYIAYIIWLISTILMSNNRFFLIRSFFISLFWITLILITSSFFIPSLKQYLLNTTLKLKFNDGSGIGRLEAFHTVTERYLKQPERLLGKGFSWSTKETSFIGGTAFGSKSENIFDFIVAIFGLPFLIILFIFTLLFILRNIRYIYISADCRNGFILFSMWLIMAQFAPMHQYGITLFLLPFAIGLISKGRLSTQNNVEKS